MTEYGVGSTGTSVGESGIFSLAGILNRGMSFSGTLLAYVGTLFMKAHIPADCTRVIITWAKMAGGKLIQYMAILNCNIKMQMHSPDHDQ